MKSSEVLLRRLTHVLNDHPVELLLKSISFTDMVRRSRAALSLPLSEKLRDLVLKGLSGVGASGWKLYSLVPTRSRVPSAW